MARLAVVMTSTTEPEYLRIEPASNRRQRRVAEPVPTIECMLYGSLSELTEPEQAALKVGVIDMLQAGSDECGHGTFDRSYIEVGLSAESPIHARAYFLPGSGVISLSEAEDIADFITSDGSAVTTDGGGSEYAIVNVVVLLAEPPQTGSPTRAPTPNPSSSPTLGPSPASSFSPAVAQPTMSPIPVPTRSAEPITTDPTSDPTASPTVSPIVGTPTVSPTISPTTSDPTVSPTTSPITSEPTTSPTTSPMMSPTNIEAPMHVDGNILVRVQFSDPAIQALLASRACVDWNVTFRALLLEARVTAGGTLCPTAAPFSSSPTADPTVPPSTALSIGPTMVPITIVPTTTPSQQPPVILPPDTAASGAEESNGAAEGSIAAIVGALLIMMVVMGVVVQRRQRHRPKEGAEKPGFDELSASAASELENISTGIAVVVPATIAATSAGNRLWSDFRRVVSFDVLYYDNPIMKLDGLALHDVYALLEISCPPGAYLDNLRAVGGRWLKLPFSASNADDLVNDAVEFFLAAMPDCLVERAIDLLALSNLEAGAEETEALYALIDEVFSSNPRKFLVRDKSGNAQMNPYAAIREVHRPEPEYFEVGNDGTEGVYQFRTEVGESGYKPGEHYYTDIFAGTPFAHAPASSEYDLVSGEAENDATYDVGASAPGNVTYDVGDSAPGNVTYDVGASPPEDTYSSAQAEEESMYAVADSGKPPTVSKGRPEGTYSLGSSTEANNYSMGSAPEENNYSIGSAPEENNYSTGSAPEENNYSLGSAPEENNYSLGSAPAEPTYGVAASGGNNTYSLGANESTEDTYAIANAVGIGTTESTDGEAIYGLTSGRGNAYSLGSFEATESTDDSEATYGLASGTGGGGLQFKSADSRGDVDAIYANASSSPVDTTVIKPAAYEAGARDLIYGNPGVTGDVDQVQSQYELAAPFLTPGLRSCADLALTGEDRNAARTSESAVQGYVDFTPGGDGDCDSHDLAGQDGSSAYVTCLRANSDLNSLPGDLQPSSVTVDYMECVPDDGRESPFATPGPVDVPNAATTPKSSDIPQPRWKALGKWMKGKGKERPKKHKEVPSPSLDVVHLDGNVILADSGSGRRPLDRGYTAASLGGVSATSVDVDDDVASLATFSNQGGTFEELNNPYFLSARLTQHASTTTDKNSGLRFKSMHRSNPLAASGKDDSTGEMSKTSTLTMDPKSGLRFKSMHRSNPLLSSHGDSADDDTDDGVEDHFSMDGRTESYLGPMVRAAYEIPGPKKMASQEAFHFLTAPPRALTFTEDEGMLETAAVFPPDNLSPPLRRRSISYGSAMAEADAGDHIAPSGAEATEATLKPMLESEDEGSRPWTFSIGRFSKRISRRAGKDLNTPTNISAPSKRLPMLFESDNVDRPMDTGYIKTGNAELALPFPDDEVDAEWDDIQHFLSTVVADADNVNHPGPIEGIGVAGQQQAHASSLSYVPETGPRKRRESRRASLV